MSRADVEAGVKAALDAVITLPKTEHGIIVLVSDVRNLNPFVIMKEAERRIFEKKNVWDDVDTYGPSA